MSIKAMNIVRESGLKKTPKSIARELADYADDDGRGIYPAVSRVAWSTGYSERNVRRTIHDLETAGVLVFVRVHPEYQTNEYRMDFDALPKRPSYWEFMENRRLRGSKDKQGGDNLSGGGQDVREGVTRCPGGGDTVSPKPLLDPLLDPSLNGDDVPSTVIHGIAFEDYESLFLELLPKKTRPREKTKRRRDLVKAWETRTQDDHFRKNWETAVRKASKSPTLQNEKWFQLEYLLRNDSTIDNVLDEWMSWKDEQLRPGRSKNGERVRKGGAK